MPTHWQELYLNVPGMDGVLLVHVLLVDDIITGFTCAPKGHGAALFCAGGADWWGRDGVDGMCVG